MAPTLTALKFIMGRRRHDVPGTMTFFSQGHGIRIHTLLYLGARVGKVPRIPSRTAPHAECFLIYIPYKAVVAKLFLPGPSFDIFFFIHPRTQSLCAIFLVFVCRAASRKMSVFTAT